MSCTVYMVICNFVIHATCPLALTMYKYKELQMSSITPKLNYKASSETPFFSHNVKLHGSLQYPFHLFFFLMTWCLITICLMRSWKIRFLNNLIAL